MPVTCLHPPLAPDPTNLVPFIHAKKSTLSFAGQKAYAAPTKNILKISGKCVPAHFLPPLLLSSQDIAPTFLEM